MPTHYIGRNTAQRLRLLADHEGGKGYAAIERLELRRGTKRDLEEAAQLCERYDQTEAAASIRRNLPPSEPLSAPDMLTELRLLLGNPPCGALANARAELLLADWARAWMNWAVYLHTPNRPQPKTPEDKASERRLED